MSKYTPKTKNELMALVKDENIYLGDIDTSNITDMSELFRDINRNDFSGIEKWDVSKVEDMRSMFSHCPNFNQDLSSWDVSKVEDMSDMFYGCKYFNQDLSSWNVSNVKDMCSMFQGCKSFNQDLSSWDVSNVTNMEAMFYGCKITEEQAFSGELKEQSSKPKKQR